MLRDKNSVKRARYDFNDYEKKCLVRTPVKTKEREKSFIELKIVKSRNATLWRRSLR